MSLFKITAALLGQIAAVVKAYDECYVHGDGNIYVKNEKGEYPDSKFRKEFANPKQEESTYRVKYGKGDRLPTTVGELEKDLLDSRNQERRADAVVKNISGVKTITVDAPPPPVKTQAELDEEELQRQIDEEAKGK